MSGTALQGTESSLLDKYDGLNQAIMCCTFTRLGLTYATQGQQADESGCVHWCWADALSLGVEALLLPHAGPLISPLKPVKSFIARAADSLLDGTVRDSTRTQ